MDIKPLLHTAGDCFHFVTEFFEVINISATHIYTSALALTPETSIVRKLYSRYVPTSPRVVVGLPTSWDPRTASISLSTDHPNVIWSPCGRCVAISTDTGIEIRDSTTLEKLTALKSPMNLSLSAVSITYSPNSRFLACACTRPFAFWVAIAIWDVQTGGIVNVIHDGERGYPRSMLYSADARILSVACGRSPYKWTVCTFDTVSGKRGYTEELESEFGVVFWREKNSIRFATSQRTREGICIEIREITPTSMSHPKTIDTSRVPHEFGGDNHQIFFSPQNLEISVVSTSSTIIRDVRSSNLLLESPTSRMLGTYAGHFSPDGSLFACTANRDLQIWKMTTGGYTPFARFPLRFSTAAGGGCAFSPDSESIIAWGFGIMEVWKLDHHSNSPPSEPPLDIWDSHLVAFSKDRKYVAIGRASWGVVNVVNLHTGDLELIIDADLAIADIKIAEDTVVALSGERVVGWSLSAGVSEGEYGVRHADLDESLKIVELESGGLDMDPRFLDDQCRKAIFSAADDIIIFDADTGADLVYHSFPSRFRDLRSSPDGQQLWVSVVHTEHNEARGGEGEVNGEGVFALTDEEESEEGFDIVEVEGMEKFALVPLPNDIPPPDHPWKSTRGYAVGGLPIQWVLDRDGKRLFWLPPYLRASDERMWRWNGDFLVLQRNTLPEPVIIELCST